MLPSSEDFNLIVASLTELYSATDMTSFPPVSLRILNRLLPKAAFSSYNEVELRTGSARIYFDPPEMEPLMEAQKPGLWKYRGQHPIMRLYEKGEHEGVHMVSDFLGEQELHQLELYTEVFAKAGIEDTLSFTLPSSRDLKVFYAINSAGRFTERDRAVARILQPHFIQAFENVLAFTEAKAMATLSAQAFRTGEHGLVLANFSGRIVHASQLASDHLDWLRGSEDPNSLQMARNEILPPALMDWLGRSTAGGENTSASLEVLAGDSRLVFRGAAIDDHHWIIGTQQQDLGSLANTLGLRFGLPPRQSEVLLWLSRGKSNSEIAAMLDISNRTVAKHIELIFEKLGVENRSSATRKVVETIS